MRARGLGVVCGCLALLVRPATAWSAPSHEKPAVAGEPTTSGEQNPPREPESAREPEPSREPTPLSRQQNTAPIGPGQRALAITGSVVPGVLVHGSGSWLADNTRTGWDLFALQGLGVGLFVAGGATIVFSGAARAVIGPAIATTVVGAGIFSSSWLLDVYDVSMPKQARGQERGARSGVRSHLDYVFVRSPQFDYGPLLRHGLSVTEDRMRLSYEAQHAPVGGFDQLRFAFGYKAWQAPTDRSGGALELQLGTSSLEHLGEDFVTRGVELSARLRLDGRNWSRSIDGAFTEFEVGVAGQRTSWLAVGAAPAAASTESVLIAKSAIGIYLGDPWDQGGELQLYYDHRHDGLAEGMLAEGLGSGALGHVGVLGEYFFGRNFGLRLTTEVGSAWVLGAGINVRSER